MIEVLDCAIFGNVRDLTTKRVFIGSPDKRLQFSIWNYGEGEVLQAHIHKERRRVIERTEESWIVMQGAIEASIFDEKKELIHTQKMQQGDYLISYRGGHGFKILEDNTIVIENKLGDFVDPVLDKEKF